MKSAIQVFKEQLKYFQLIRRISLYEIRSKNSDNYLGVAWELISPLIQIVIYWFVFGVGIRQGGGRGPVDDIPYFPWMLSGILVWFFFQPSIVQGSKSIYSKLRMLSKMRFPMSVIPNIAIFSKLYPHIILVVLAIVFFQFTGFTINQYYVQLPYFMLATIVFLFSVNLITSTLTTMIRDIQQLIQATMRMLLYLAPILWDPSHLNPVLQKIMMLNPLYYLVEGYRASLVGGNWYIVNHWEYTLYFWAFTLVVFLIGAAMHVKFRRHFIDFL
ncbi:ABC transporter permease [Terribacillus saccharophilus]|uniref:Transport permease protein n=1 Tax=Terribacillus saccharophilus TaxID=361277 RepID=A0AAX2EFI3_9BACI|nr:ABC transporter permease [Terribacillus saccharophilus]SEN31331.1 teichoic acid transport system permease protein [Terribacillus saccharophilus]